ncbi:WbqC family protein [Agarivorans albus]
MKIGIMQPYFLPYLGYFQLMNEVDQWVVFDDVQFIDKGWVNRNRVLHPNENKEWQFLGIPLSKRGQFDKIKDVKIHNVQDWKEQMAAKLTFLKKSAPYYFSTMKLLNECLSIDTDNLSQQVIYSLKVVSDYLGISTPISIQSKENIPVSKVEHPGQWALKIAQYYQADTYINPPGGHSIFNQQEFDEANIELAFLISNLKPYSQNRVNFVEGLSIIDLLMWNSLSDVKAMLNNEFAIKSKSDLVF